MTGKIAGIRIEPGALLFGDCKGVLVVPKAVVGELIAKAQDVAAMENKVEYAIKSGMSTAETFKTYGVM